MPNICESTAYFLWKENSRLGSPRRILLDRTHLHCTSWSVKRSKSSIKRHAETSHLVNMRLDIPLTAHSVWPQLFFLSGKPHTSASCKWCEEITDLRQLPNGHGQQPVVRFHRTQSPPPLSTRKDGGGGNNISGTQGGLEVKNVFFFLGWLCQVSANHKWT